MRELRTWKVSEMDFYVFFGEFLCPDEILLWLLCTVCIIYMWRYLMMLFLGSDLLIEFSLEVDKCFHFI